VTETPTSDARREAPVRAESILEAVEEAFGPEPRDQSSLRRDPVAARRTESTPSPSEPGPAHPPGLTSPHPAERRLALDRILADGIASHQVEAVTRVLLSDPDPQLRAKAARALTGAQPPPRYELVQRALLDPSDSVRALAVGLVARAGAAAISGLVPLVGDREWPLAQQAATEGLSELVRESGRLPDRDLDRLLAAVAALDPPPLPSERSALEELARAIGIDRLARELNGPDPRRLGAARLLVAEASAAALRAVSTTGDDLLEAVRSLARRATAELQTRPDVDAAPSETLDRERIEAEPESGDVVFVLAGALEDPAEAVRERARAALSALPRAEVVDLAERSLHAGDEEEGAAAAMQVQSLGLTECAGALLQRACASSEDARGPYLRALSSLRLGPEELASLAGAEDGSHRPDAVRLVWQIGGRAVLPFLVSLLEDSIAAVRMAVLEVFSESGDPAGVTLANELLRGDSSAAVRATAVHALARLGGEGRLAGLALALADPDPDVRATAVETLPAGAAIPATGGETGGRSGAELLTRALEDEDARVSRAAATRLATLGDRNTPAVWEALRVANAPVRDELIRQIERRDPGRLAALSLAYASAPDPSERVLALELAVRVATPESTAAVVAALGDPDPTVRRVAASGMSSLRSPSAVEALSRSLADPRADIRVEAVRALGLIDDDAVPTALITALKDPEVRVRETAVEALVRWRSPAVARRLAQALASPDVRRPSGDVLERMGTVAVEPLVDVVVAGDPEARAAAGALLERIAGPERFRGDLGSTDPDARLRAVEVLGAIGGRIAANSLLQPLADPDIRVRSRAATLLGALGDARALPALKRVFLSDPVVEVAVAAEAALRALGAPPDADQGGGEEEPEGDRTRGDPGSP
jgi:HEAT repeat protein